jgi:hypothetical protein
MPRRKIITSRTLGFTAAIAATIALASPVLANDTVTPELQFANGHFAPSNLTVPANQGFKVSVKNASPSAIEFESFELHRERVVRPGETITVNIDPLAPGSYEFFDDFHHDIPKGQIVSK